MAGRITRAVLHTLRDRLHTGEAVNVMTQLPMALKAVYAEGWKFSDKARNGINTETDFIEATREEDRLAQKKGYWG